MADADLNFYFDPVCPFAWMTSKWVRQVAAQRDYAVEWRFISLRLLNAHIDYAAHFPPEYEAGHTAGLRLLRVATRVRAEHGREAIGPLYEAFGRHIFEVDRQPDPATGGSRDFVGPILAEVGLPASLADAVDDESADAELRGETEEALALTGRDVGTPILHFRPPEGVAFFGPVISWLPDDGRPSSSGTTSSRWRAIPVSPSSSEACASNRSCLPSASGRARPVPRRTGMPGAGV
jgi:2-hydroxychromene-2-carboxylate isomerase